MSHVSINHSIKLALWFVVLFAAMFFLNKVSVSANPNIALSEARFIDLSPSGLQIVPASCASSPSLFHLQLPPTFDGKGFYVQPGWSEAGANAANAGMYVCVTNSSSNTYFIPANSAAELQSFKNVGNGTLPGIQTW